MSRKLLHTHALLNKVQLIYVCRFIAADLEKPGQGRTLWRVADFNEAMDLWRATIGEPHDQGKFVLSAEAVYEETQAIPRPRKPDPNLDFWPERASAVSTELPYEASGGPDDQGAVAAEGADARGDAGADRVDHGSSP